MTNPIFSRLFLYQQYLSYNNRNFIEIRLNRIAVNADSEYIKYI